MSFAATAYTNTQSAAVLTLLQILALENCMYTSPYAVKPDVLNANTTPTLDPWAPTTAPTAAQQL